MTQVLVADIFVTNSGKKPGVIKSLSIKGEGEDKFRYFKSEMQKPNSAYLNQGIDTNIVEPGNSQLLRRYLATDFDVNAFESTYSNSSLLLEVVNFSGKTRKISLKVKNRTPMLFK
jgi:hypothetical protein